MQDQTPASFRQAQTSNLLENNSHKPCLAREAETWSASVASCGDSIMLMLPVEDMLLSRQGEPSLEGVGDT